MIHIIKYLANMGVASRRKVERLIREGQVEVNGRQVIDPALTINPEKDKILVGGKRVEVGQRIVHIMLNKPKGIISTASDEKGRKTVLDLVKVSERVYPVGRLDEDSTGLIIMTNDGELANFITHPRYGVPKTYQAAIRGKVTEERLDKLRMGIKLKEGLTAPAEVEVINPDPKQPLLEITIHEGWNRQIRRMCGEVGLTVVALKRVAIGPLQLGNLKWGQWRYLTEEEVGKLKQKPL